MNWVGKVYLLACSLAVAVTLLSYLSGFGWLSFIATLPAFLAVTVFVPFFLGARDRRLAAEKRRREGKRRRAPRRRMSGPVPAVAIAARAPLAERGGRVVATLPAAPR